MRRIVIISIIQLLLIFGASACSSSDQVRSGSGPETGGTATSGPFDPDASNSGESTTTTAAADAEPSTSPVLAIVGTVTVPDGESGELSVVLNGSAVDESGSVPVVVRNRTDATVYGVEASATARTTDGSLAGTGSSQGFAPSTVAPGEWSFGYVYFDGQVPAGAQFDITATAETDADSIGSVDVAPIETNLVPGEFGGQQIVGIVENSTEEEVAGPVDVQVLCFDQAGTAVASTHRGYTDADTVAAQGTASFSVDLFEAACPNYVVGASGYDF